MNDEMQRPGYGSAAGRLWERLMDAIERGVVGFFRQSSLKQARRHLGSQRAQEEQLENVVPFGVRPEQVRVILAYGESGRANVVRKKFRELLQLIRDGRVGLILLARHDRLGRNFEDAEELFRAMRENGVLIMVDGRVYDPSDESDDFILTVYAKFAEFENRARARWMSLTRFAKARDRSLVIGLPTGLIWADPEDPEYRRRLAGAGMIRWLDNLSAHTVSSMIQGRRHYILPYPDAHVERCVRLLVGWILETGSISEVARRVAEGHDGWPKPGHLPVRQGERYFGPGSRIGWSHVTPPKVYDFLRSPALYGTYQYRAPALGSHRPKQRRLGENDGRGR